MESPFLKPWVWLCFDLSRKKTKTKMGQTVKQGDLTADGMMGGLETIPAWTWTAHTVRVIRAISKGPAGCAGIDAPAGPGSKVAPQAFKSSQHRIRRSLR